jgi:hypothetical protein
LVDAGCNSDDNGDHDENDADAQDVLAYHADVLPQRLLGRASLQVAIFRRKSGSTPSGDYQSVLVS